MNAAQINDLLLSRFGPAAITEFVDDKHPRAHVTPAAWREVAEFLHDADQLKLDWLANLSGVDYAADARMAVVYDLWSFDLRHRFAVKVFLPRAEPRLPTVSGIWRSAEWHEREAFDLLGIHFDEHPDPRRILCADDWEGFPLRKDYVFPREYHGIPGSVELDWKQQPR